MQNEQKQQLLPGDKASEIAASLRIIPRFPEEALKPVALWLARNCTPDEAQAVIGKAVESWHTWQGVAGLIDIRHSLKQPTRFDDAPTPEQIEQWEREGATYDPNFKGNVVARMTGRNSAEQWRQIRLQSIRDALASVGDKKCDQKFWPNFLAQMEREYPDEVAAIRAGRELEPLRRPPASKMPPNRPPVPATVITPADIAAAPKLDRLKPCEICEGTGRIPDGYCECRMGRDLERVEKRAPAARIEPNYTGGRDGDSEFHGGPGETG